jgi:glycosyltransferase involved in cell wall biosynthesis
MKKGLSVLVFAYNEEKFIKQTIKNIIKPLVLSRINFEIIILNDGSNDKTKHIIENNFGNKSNVRIYNLKKNIGLSRLLQLGITKAKFDKLTWFPGDNSYLNKNLKNFFIKSNCHNFVIGFRKNLHDFPFFRRFLSLLNRAFINILNTVKIKDVHGLLIARVSDLKKIKFISSGYSLMIDILPSITIKNVSYYQAPVYINKKTIKNTQALSLQTFKDFIFCWCKVLIKVKILNK